MPNDPYRSYLTAAFATQVRQVAAALRDAADRIESCAIPTGNAVVGSPNYGRVDYTATARQVLSHWLNLGPNTGIGQVFAAAASIAEYDRSKPKVQKSG